MLLNNFDIENTRRMLANQLDFRTSQNVLTVSATRTVSLTVNQHAAILVFGEVMNEFGLCANQCLFHCNINSFIIMSIII